MLRRSKGKPVVKQAVGEVQLPVRGANDVITDEQFVFGGADDVVEKLEESVASKKRKRKVQPVDLKSAWIDDDDTALQIKVAAKDHRHSDLKHLHGKAISSTQYTQAISHQYEKSMGMQPEWARLGKSQTNSDDDSDADDLLRSTGNYLAASDSLPAGVIQMNKCSDINRDRPIKGKMKCVEFHPSAQVALTAGMDCTLSLFQIDGRHNPKIQSIFVERFPIYSAHFSPSGNEVLLGSKSKALYTYDLMEGRTTLSVIRGIADTQSNAKRLVPSPDGKCVAVLGRDGNVHIISARSKEWIDSVKMNGNVEAVAFNTDGSRMFTFGDDSNVYVWNMNTRSCVHRFTDDGCIQGTSLAVSKGDRYIAAGSQSGVVNIYDYEAVLSTRQPRPLKAVMNLTTACTRLAFNSTAEILAAASNVMEGAIKLVHIPSLSVFSNFPTNGDRLRIPACLDFSLHSGYFTVGNNKGQALLYRVKHYADY